MLFDVNDPEQFPHAQVIGERVYYIGPLALGRARINQTTLDRLYEVQHFW